MFADVLELHVVEKLVLAYATKDSANTAAGDEGRHAVIQATIAGKRNEVCHEPQRVWTLRARLWANPNTLVAGTSKSPSLNS
jgi:hypothetical protein